MGDSEHVGDAGRISPSLRRLVDAGARWVLLPSWRGYSGATWLEGLILAESGGDPGAVRYERHLDQGDSDSPGRDDGTREDDKSYGLMQVLGLNLRAMTGVPYSVVQDYSWALFPMANLAFGLRHLAGLLSQANRDVATHAPLTTVVHDVRWNSSLFVLEGPVDLALARYNGGPRGNAAADWPNLRNWSYVERIAQHAELARTRRRSLNWIEAE